ncbi:uncharacterized protein [Physcomitrium patens]|uniref:uncharacterized protein n=1 Tax=Physcomitrium patens TaxID=3218 RepID=UPI003CCCF8C7
MAVVVSGSTFKFARLVKKSLMYRKILYMFTLKTVNIPCAIRIALLLPLFAAFKWIYIYRIWKIKVNSGICGESISAEFVIKHRIYSIANGLNGTWKHENPKALKSPT